MINDQAFPLYTEYDPKVPVYCITPNDFGFIHRFYDTSPISPSGKYLALIKFPFEDHYPRRGDKAQVVVFDLVGGTNRVVYETMGWDTQLGAQIQWGKSDNYLYFNDFDLSQNKPFGVHYDLESGEIRKLTGTIYMISPCGKYAVCPDLIKMRNTQLGYGVVVDKSEWKYNNGAARDDGVYICQLDNGSSTMLVSIAEIVSALSLVDLISSGDFYCFHVKWSPDGTRLMLVLRWLPKLKGNRLNFLITLNADGSNIQLALPADAWSRGGHHPNWYPDSENIIMNLNFNGVMRFVKIKYDGSSTEIVAKDLMGSGHPSVHQSLKYLITDTYTHECDLYSEGVVPIRFVDLEKGEESHIIKINSKPIFSGQESEWRIDPHPAWCGQHKRIIFNGSSQGRRQVFIGDLTSIL